MKEKEESEKISLKLNIQKTKIMASGPITLRIFHILLWPAQSKALAQSMKKK